MLKAIEGVGALYVLSHVYFLNHITCHSLEYAPCCPLPPPRYTHTLRKQTATWHFAICQTIAIHNRIHHSFSVFVYLTSCPLFELLLHVAGTSYRCFTLTLLFRFCFLGVGISTVVFSLLLLLLFHCFCF